MSERPGTPRHPAAVLSAATGAVTSAPKAVVLHQVPVPTRGEHYIACFEATKGVLVILAGFGILSLMHMDVQRFAKAFVDHLHLTPTGLMSHLFLRVSQFSSQRLLLLAAASYCYAGLRLLEAYGLWRARKWAKWVAVASGGIYVPYELYEAVYRTTPMKVLALLFNVGIVAYMAYSLWRGNQLALVAVKKPVQPAA